MLGRCQSIADINALSKFHRAMVAILCIHCSRCPRHPTCSGHRNPADVKQPEVNSTTLAFITERGEVSSTLTFMTDPFVPSGAALPMSLRGFLIFLAFIGREVLVGVSHSHSHSQWSGSHFTFLVGPRARTRTSWVLGHGFTVEDGAQDRTATAGFQ